jgi:creatinine amidohydrolase/Fe(II)-dependent formamide hydrolase-like protein
VDFEAIAEVNAAFLVPELGTSGVLGDPHAASAEAGRELLGAVATALVRLIDGEDEDLGWNAAAELTTDENVDNLEETT